MSASRQLESLSFSLPLPLSSRQPFSINEYGISFRPRRYGQGITNFLRGNHLGVSTLGVLQEDFLNSRFLVEVTQGLDAVHDPLVGVFVDRHGHKLRLADTDD